VAKGRRAAEELPPDNTARIVLYDAVTQAAETEHSFDGLTEGELFDRVIPRLRVLVPRELHNLGEQEYVATKIAACVDAGVLQRHPRREAALITGATVPRVRYPDATIRDYTAGLEAARERLDADETRLRRGGFDVRNIVRSPANAKKSDRYRKLVESMQEHGFLDYFPIIESSSGAVVDGVARVAAAAEADVLLKKRVLPTRRDTPLQQALLVLHLNAERLEEGEASKVYDAIAARTGRSWLAIEDDLALTREWRRAEPKDYDAKLDVDLVPFGVHSEPKVQITTDGTRVMLRSVMREAGIPEYARDYLLPYVAWEEARTQYSGKKAIFVRIADAVEGIGRMQRERARRGLKVDPAWEDVRQWLLDLNPRKRRSTAPS
jgi:hypothetical protein